MVVSSSTLGINKWLLKMVGWQWLKMVGCLKWLVGAPNTRFAGTIIMMSPMEIVATLMWKEWITIYLSTIMSTTDRPAQEAAAATSFGCSHPISFNGEEC